MSGSQHDTIFAIASGQGAAAIRIIRLSGACSGKVVNALCGGRVPQPRRAVVRKIVDAKGNLLDRCMVLWLPGPHTYTGEDMAELQVHGGPAVVRGVISALVVTGVRPAEPGEFTRRAFMAGRMDLLEAEGVADLIAAETEGQRKQALRQMEGAQSGLVATWRERMARLLAFQEALIDFADDEVPDALEGDLLADMGALASELREHALLSRRGERLRDGLVFTIVGAPNAGKSSLLNRLAGRDAAIVSSSPGTTRDMIDVSLDLGGVLVTLVDTAGLRDSGDAVEMEGVRRALVRAQSADMVIEVIDASGPAEAFAGAALRLANKCDLASAPCDALPMSALTGMGMPEVYAELERLAQLLTSDFGHPSMTRARHGAALTEAADALDAAARAPSQELRAEELRLAMQALGRITGAVDIEGILDVVFGSFCIGK